MQISRSEQKRRIQDFERLVAQLVTLPARTLEQLSCDEEIRQQVLAIIPLKGSVRQRQIKYLTKLLLREELAERIAAFVHLHKGKDLAAKSRQRSVEQWRNALIDEALARESAWQEDERLVWGENWPSQIVREIARELPKVDQNHLRRLAYRFTQTRNPRYSREIFRYLHSAGELQQRDSQRQEALRASSEGDGAGEQVE